MDNKRILCIIGLVLTFFACLAIGVVLPIGEKKSNTLFASNTGGGGGGGGGGSLFGGEVPESNRPQSEDATRPDPENTGSAEAAEEAESAEAATSTEEEYSAASESAATPETGKEADGVPGEPATSATGTPAEPAAPEAAPAGDTMPVLDGKPLVGRANRRFGFACRAKATVASGDPLEYRLCEVGRSEAKYTSRNGGFALVVPSESGKYDLVVVNTRTGEQLRETIGGFDKVTKLSAGMLQEKLNKPMDDWFYIYFADDKDLKIDYEYIPEGFVPAQSIGALMSDRSANGWTIEVVGTPQYDEYNQVRRFKVRIKE